MINPTVNTQSGGTNATLQTVNILRNGMAVVGASMSQVQSASGTRLPMSTSTLLSLTAGDTISVTYTTNKNDTIQPNDTHIAIHFMSS